MQLLYLALAGFAFRGLLTFGSQADLSREIEEWFFIPTETSPLVVVLLGAWLVYRRSERLERLASAAPAWGLAIPALVVGVGSFAWSAKTLAPDLMAVSLLFSTLGIAGIHFGRDGMRIVLLPCLLLLFAVPMPAPILAEVLYHFQLWTAEASGWLLFLIGQSAYVSGDQVLLSGAHFQVIEGCSGLRSVQTLTMVAVLLVELFGRRGWHALAIIGLAPFLAFGLNGLRVLTLILNQHSEVVAIHNVQGVAILLVGLAILYSLDGVLQRYEKPEAAGEAPAGAPGAAPFDRARTAVAAGSLGLMGVLSLALTPWALPEPQPVAPSSVPFEIGGRAGERIEYDRSFLGTIGHRTLIDRRYRGPDGEVELFLLLGDLAQRHRSPISPKTLPPGSGWILEQSGDLERPGAFASSWSVLRSGSHRVLVHHWYEGSDGLASELVRGLVALDASPWHRERDVMAVRLSTEIVGATAGALDAARARLDQFEEDLEPELTRIRSRLIRKQVS